MAEKWDVSSWDSRAGPRAKQFHGCFETRFGADRYIETESRDIWTEPTDWKNANIQGMIRRQARDFP